MAAWEQALINAAKHGYISRDAPLGNIGSRGKSSSGRRARSNHLILNANVSLLRDLEIPGLGQPVALSTVFVRLLSLPSSELEVLSSEVLLLTSLCLV